MKKRAIEASLEAIASLYLSLLVFTMFVTWILKTWIVKR